MAVSSSAASYSASMVSRTASSVDNPARYLFLSADFANSEPEPIAS